MVFPPLQFAGNEMVRPDGTLALPYLDACLTQAGFESNILDMSIGTSKDKLEDTFYKQEVLNSKLNRVGMNHQRILEEVKPFDVIAITSIFTQQTSRVFEISNLIKGAYPEKILITGGVNARSLKEHFFDNGFDFICITEGERSIVALAQFLDNGTPSLSDVPGMTYRLNGKIKTNHVGQLLENLDEIPMPSWEKLPNEKYWEIGRIWGGREGWMDPTEIARYAAIFTSRGCPFSCSCRSCTC